MSSGWGEVQGKLGRLVLAELSGRLGKSILFSVFSSILGLDGLWEESTLK